MVQEMPFKYSSYLQLLGNFVRWHYEEHIINPSLELVQPRKTGPYITEKLLMGRKESNQTKWGTFLKLF